MNVRDDGLKVPEMNCGVKGPTTWFYIQFNSTSITADDCDDVWLRENSMESILVKHGVFHSQILPRRGGDVWLAVQVDNVKIAVTTLGWRESDRSWELLLPGTLFVHVFGVRKISPVKDDVRAPLAREEQMEKHAERQAPGLDAHLPLFRQVSEWAGPGQRVEISINILHRLLGDVGLRQGALEEACTLRSAGCKLRSELGTVPTVELSMSGEIRGQCEAMAETNCQDVEQWFQAQMKGGCKVGRIRLPSGQEGDCVSLQSSLKASAYRPCPVPGAAVLSVGDPGAETFYECPGGGASGSAHIVDINSLFLTDLYSPEYPGPSHRIKKTVQVEQSKVLIKEGGVQLLLTIVDTPGFGDAVDNSNCWQPVIDYIDSKFEDYLNAESRVNRRQMPDNRVQCCLYFIAPSGHGLKPLDIEFMKRLHEQIMKEIQEHKIKIYEFPETDDEEENKLVKKIKDRLPLAVVGSNTIIEVNGKRVRGRQYPWGVAEVENGEHCSNTIIEVNGKRVRGRQYPWGVAEVENGEHCDFTILRNMLIRTHMQDLKDVINNVHYENYRSRKLAAVTYNGVDNSKNKGQLTKSPLAQMEEERREHVAKMKKMEMEMEQVFEMKVKEKVQKLKDSEAELQRRHEQMKKNLEAQHKELEEKRRQFEDEKANWEAQQRILEQQNSSRTLEKNKKKGKIF
ncbi:Septin-7 [Saguinus oedipus]|uniref:Septin-7 n=1 Tax=Saguinus oedipus TaxID=9490 RepID=A0ABQ9VNQ1_SAGOE|nr:Septin-7 [Saguinus oedipus]